MCLAHGVAHAGIGGRLGLKERRLTTSQSTLLRTNQSTVRIPTGEPDATVPLSEDFGDRSVAFSVVTSVGATRAPVQISTVPEYEPGVPPTGCLGKEGPLWQAIDSTVVILDRLPFRRDRKWLQVDTQVDVPNGA